MLHPNSIRNRVDKLREDVKAKRAAEEAAKAAMADGKGPMGVTLLRTNAELDGNLEGHFPGHDFLVAKGGVVRRAVLAAAGDLGFHSGNMLLVRCACLKTTCMCFVPLTFSLLLDPMGILWEALEGSPLLD